ncbi:MAG TPA: hypothetical protein DIW31_01100 [Bacteroidales bacterium]|nr:hypothetical protein [Bacteroidales bacterium]
MRYFNKYVMILLCALLFQNSRAQNNLQTLCRIEDGKLIFQINLKWSLDKRIEISKQYDLDSLVLAKVFEGETNFKIANETWSVTKVTPQIVELSKVLDEQSSVSKNNVLLMFDNNSSDKLKYKGAEFANFGVNRFKIKSAFQYINGIAIFFLPNNSKAQKVYLSGTFNDWSTMQTPMHKSDSGWVVAIKLQPGMYYYKYIIDGKWKEDPNNINRISDGNWGYNSITYCYNFQFELKGKDYAQRVYVAGSFNNWNPDELKMSRTKSGWVLPMFLREGTHAYKFIIDGTWIIDPANSVSRPDGRGNINSFVGIGEEYQFKLEGYSLASKVFLTGDFNDWNQRELGMERTPGGWQISYALGAGNYEYKFIVDGKFITDPKNPYKTGKGNYINSFLAFKANHVFTLNKFLTANNVCISGSFNNWSRDSRMAKKDGKWVFPIFLRPGKYTYKFIIDGDWILDPDNKLWEENEFGTGNSVLWIQP